MPREVIAKSVLNKKKRRDPWFLDNYTFNPYSGCAFACLYCYIRGSKYGLNMEETLSAKVNAIELLDKALALRAKKGEYGFIVVSSATDPYLKLEESYELTRRALQTILKYRFPVHIITKSDLVKRDFDILKEIDKKAILPDDLEEVGRRAIITFSFSSLDDSVNKVFEPGATPPSQRLEALKSSKENDFLTGVSLMPLLPYITDTTQSLEHFFSVFSSVPIDYIFPASLTLFGSGRADSKTLMLNAIDKHYPELTEKYQKLFGNSDQLPFYYRNAFNKKMNQLCESYQIKNRLI